MRVLILSMTPQRDWIVDTMIADAVKERGHEVFLRKFLSDDRTAVIVERPDVAIIPVVRCEYTRDLAIRLKQWGIRVISRRSEAGVSRDSYERSPRRWQIDFIGRYDYKDLVDLELIWGREFADILIEEGKIRPEQVRIIGGIPLDPYFKWNLKKGSEEAFGESINEWLAGRNLDPHKKTLYFITGFVHADKSGYSLPEAPLGDPMHLELHERDKVLRNLWLEAIRKFSDTGKYNIIVRPHHGEDLSFWRQLNHNIHISTDGSAGGNLYYSDVLIHAGSTMAVEAHILEKPAFRLGNTAQDQLIGEISPHCESIDDLIDRVESVELDKSNANIANLADLESSFYGPIDGKAHRRCADAVCELEPSGRLSIPDSWPEEELQDYSSEGVLKISAKDPVVYCRACRKPSQNLNSGISWRCPHCGIMITKVRSK